MEARVVEDARNCYLSYQSTHMIPRGREERRQDKNMKAYSRILWGENKDKSDIGWHRCLPIKVNT